MEELYRQLEAAAEAGEDCTAALQAVFDRCKFEGHDTVYLPSVAAPLRINRPLELSQSGYLVLKAHA